jgi:hypothetical protein
VPSRKRADGELPSVATISADEFMELTTDVWELPPESATRVGHPAPFPVELPRRLIDLYTYEGDLVLDPFMGSGSTAVAAARTGRHYVGFDTDPTYVDQALARLAHEPVQLPGPSPIDPPVAASARAGFGSPSGPARSVAADAGAVPAVPPASARSIVTGATGATGATSTTGGPAGATGATGGPAAAAGATSAGARLVWVPATADNPSGRRRASSRGGEVAAAAAVAASTGSEAGPIGVGLGLGAEVESAIRLGRKAKDVVALMLAAAGFEKIESSKTLKVAGLPIDFRARDRSGRVWVFDVIAGFSAGNPGLRRTDSCWRALGKASGLAALVPDLRYVLFTVDLPLPGTPPGRALAAVQGMGQGKTITDVVRLLEAGDVARLRKHAGGDG